MCEKELEKSIRFKISAALHTFTTFPFSGHSQNEMRIQKEPTSCSMAMTTMPKDAKSRQNCVYISHAPQIPLLNKAIGHLDVEDGASGGSACIAYLKRDCSTLSGSSAGQNSKEQSGQEKHCSFEYMTPSCQERVLFFLLEFCELVLSVVRK